MGTRYICATLLAFASIISTSSAALNMNHICALVNNGLRISSNEACDVFYSCSNGIATMQTCNAGYAFDKESQSCMPESQVNCYVASKTPCLNAAIGTWAPVANSCSGFYYCGSNGAVQSSCPGGENFNPNTQACVWADLYPCSQTVEMGDGSSDNAGNAGASISINLCNFIPNGIYFGSASNCTGWNKCVDNVLVTGFCPSGYLYNPFKIECDLPSYVSCSQVTNDPYLTSNTCSVKSEIKASSVCSSYYVCDGSYYQVVKCPTGLYFDTVSQTCVSRLNARNDCDRCAGVTDSFVNMYSAQNCTGYLYCINGHEAASGFCPTGTYFNERNGACVNTAEPMFGCCNPAVYASPSPTTVQVSDNSTTDETTATNKTTEVETTEKDTVTTEKDTATTV